MKPALAALLLFALALLTLAGAQTAPTAADMLFGFRDAAAQLAREKQFMAVPDPRQAEEHLRILTRAPHMAGTPEDRATAEYVAQKYREAGLDAGIVEYKVWINYPEEIVVTTLLPDGKTVAGPTQERVSGDPFQDDKRIVGAFSGYSPSGDAEGELVYANYGRPEDFRKLAEMKIDVRGKIIAVRYGQNFRGVKSFVAQENGAAGVIIFSDPADDGFFKGDPYPKGPWRPESAVQRGSIGYMFEYAGDPTTPGIASLPDLPEAHRTAPEQASALPRIPTTPLSWGDTRPMMEALGGPESPREWQGTMPFTYHLGPGPVRVRLHLKQDYGYRTIWNVIGTVKGSLYPEQWVVAGNHRDAWVYGAVDPNSGTTAQLEAVRGLGALLKSGWRPKRTMVFASWDAEEFGLIGSTEWGEHHADDLKNAVAYLNMDVGVAGPNFGASAVPSLKQFIRDVTKAVASPKGNSVYEQWRIAREREPTRGTAPEAEQPRPSPGQARAEVRVGDLGSGSDYTVFLQHLGVPSTDVGSGGSYGVYHSVFDNFEWFRKFGDPSFVYEQQMARVYGLEALRLADADVIPYSYEDYGTEIEKYLNLAREKAQKTFAGEAPNFEDALRAARRLASAGAAMHQRQVNPPAEPAALNRALIEAERGFLLPQGLPTRIWYRHAIYAPGRYTGYAAVVIPGVNEALDARNLARTREQVTALTEAINRVAGILEGASR